MPERCSALWNPNEQLLFDVDDRDPVMPSSYTARWLRRLPIDVADVGLLGLVVIDTRACERFGTGFGGHIKIVLAASGSRLLELRHPEPDATQVRVITALVVDITRW